MLCGLKDVRVHSRVVATVPDPAPDPQAMEDLVYDLTIMESTLILLLGTMMSVEGQAAYQAPIRWMPKAVEWDTRLGEQAACSSIQFLSTHLPASKSYY
jgi:hypothetical protein